MDKKVYYEIFLSHEKSVFCSSLDQVSKTMNISLEKLKDAFFKRNQEICNVNDVLIKRRY